MCNVDEGERAPVARATKSLNGTKCVKCDNPGVLITRVHDSFCKECFRVYIVHKFRSAIGKSKLIRDGEKVLVAFSGGANSATLLHLISDGLSVRAHKKLRFIPTLLHVDEFTILEDSVDNGKRLEIQQRISQLMLKSGFDSFITTLEQGLVKDNADNSLSPVIWAASEQTELLQKPLDCDKKRLKDIFFNLSSLTCKEDFLRNFRNQLIVTVARKLGFTKVLAAECSSRLSVRILTDIAQGRGSQVYLDTGFSDSRNYDVMFIRPIRDLTSKEVALYNSLFDVDSVFQQTLTTKSVSGASIERLTESFVTGLQADFPSTTSNIVRTSEKLSQAAEEPNVKCSFCKSALDTNVGAASALNSILFSKKLSIFGKAAKDNDKQCSGDESVTCDISTTESTSEMAMNDIIPFLCFGCRLSIQDFQGDVNSLPFAQKLPDKSEKPVESLRGQIAEFLLNDDC